MSFVCHRCSCFVNVVGAVLYVFTVVDMVVVILQVQFRTYVLLWLYESNRILISSCSSSYRSHNGWSSGGCSSSIVPQVVAIAAEGVIAAFTVVLQ